ncbi:ANK3 [Symbiodinium natans]|uniref:ANK3 protein n=1 Tax=Symbiodinium natans TaxID=878477 RepID=A0A812NFV9_9DINO|nr:ANK3 [Symbiodinium natans]
MGVGTNYFPMKLELEPRLKKLVSDEEFKHIEAFPSILRLLLHFDFVQELESQGPTRMQGFGGLSFSRVLDNKKLFLDSETFWVQMNYQLIHLMDFLPIADWSLRLDDTYLDVFAAVHKLLKSCGKLLVLWLHVPHATSESHGFRNQWV